MSLASAFYRFLSNRCKNLNLAQAKKVLPKLAKVGFKIDRKGRSYVQENLKLLGADHSEKAVLKVYEHFAWFMWEFLGHEDNRLLLPHLEDHRKLFEKELGPPGEQCGPRLILGSHIGNWEMGMRQLLSWGYEMTSIATPYQDKAVEKFFHQKRGHPLLHLYGLQEGIRPCLKTLDQGGIVILLCERPYGGHGVDVSLLNQTFKFPSGPGFLALKSQASIKCCKVIRKEPGQLSMHIHTMDESFVEGGYNRQEITHQIAKMIFDQVLETPEQWMTFRPYFRAQIWGGVTQ